MPDPVELKDIDLQPKAGKSYAMVDLDTEDTHSLVPTP